MYLDWKYLRCFKTFPYSGNGDSTPAAGGTTGHGSIDDMNSIGPGGMELGTPSGREDTISLDVFAEFDFLNDFSDYVSLVYVHVETLLITEPSAWLSICPHCY